ncbi:MAG: OmpA family protein [Flavobacteriales bacterium]|nr:OmpA family protein [Flavobacteriales bacterium]
MEIKLIRLKDLFLGLYRAGMMIGIILLLIAPLTSYSQEKKAVALFKQKKYSAVLDHYTRDFKKGLTNADVRLLCQSMLRLGLVSDALELAQRQYMDNPSDPEVILGLCEVLIYKGDYSAAYYLLEEIDDPSFANHEIYRIAERAAVLKEWEKREAEYDVTPLNGFNTPKNEFSLYIHNGKRIFCSSQQKDEVYQEQFDRGKKEYTSLFEAASDTAKHKAFSKGEFKGKFNIGPFEFSKDKFYFTYSEELTPGHNLLQILYTDAENPSLANAEVLFELEEEYNIAHPTFSPDGNRVIFSSDIDGGYGGMDLYYSLRTPLGWSSPINLGDIVNTKGNEVFPRLIDGQLYFSSNGHPGYGGLDIFVVTDDMHREDLRNLYAPINSPFDDFGYLRTGESSGYFSSNRPGSAGGDDIFKYEKRKVQPDMRLISGILEIEGVPQKDVKMVLTDRKGNVLEQAYTDKNGVFYFNRDPEGGEFSIRAVQDEDLTKKADLFLTDAEGNKGGKMKADNEGNFVFELLALDDYYLDYISVEDNTLFAFTLKGQLFNERPGDLDVNLPVYLLDDRGIIKKETKSTEFGFFQFNEVIPEERYWFYVETEDLEMKMAILDKNDQIIKILDVDENGRFYYDRPFDEEESISLYNEDMELVSVAMNEAINMPNILYDLNSWTLRDSAKMELEKLIDILKNNTELRIELSSHTDSRGGARYNSDLSAKRAREAWSYIVSHGIDPDRIVAIGKGEFEPVNSCIDGVNCTEEEHALNRRTEFRILSN